MVQIHKISAKRTFIGLRFTETIEEYFFEKDQCDQRILALVKEPDVINVRVSQVNVEGSPFKPGMV